MCIVLQLHLFDQQLLNAVESKVFSLLCKIFINNFFTIASIVKNVKDFSQVFVDVECTAIS